jgi:hypothetical protein
MSIKMQTQIAAMEMELTALKQQFADHRQAMNALTALVEGLHKEPVIINKTIGKPVGTDGIRNSVSGRKAEGKKPEASVRR